MIMSSVSIHYDNKELPVQVRDDGGYHVLKIGRLYESEVTIFVDSLDQLEKFAADIQEQIAKLKINAV